MSSLYENFSSLPVGSPLTPPGWNNPFGSTLILNGLVPENPNSHICQCQNGNLNQFNTFFPLQNATLQWWFSLSRNTINDATVGQLLGTQTSNGQPAVLVSVSIEADSSLSIIINNFRVDNTGLNNIYIQQEGFYWLQLNIAMSVNPVTLEIDFTQVQLGINGIKVIDKTLLHSGIFTTQVLAAITGVQFVPPVQGALLLSEITLSGLVTIPDYPNLGTTINARISQAIVEQSGESPSYAARVSQGVIERVVLPTTQNARISQAIIEIAKLNVPSPPTVSGWIVKEV